jgi:ABC-type branched-subunit amino acid transport system ATPase component
LGDGLARGGLTALVAVAVLGGLEELQLATLNVLAPELAATLGVGDNTMVVLVVAAAAVLTLAAVPLAAFADRSGRAKVIGWCSLVVAATAAVPAAAVSTGSLVLSRLGAGAAGIGSVPVANSLLADVYPIGVRGRVSGLRATGARAVAVLGCGVVALMASSTDAASSWQGVSVVVVVAGVVVAVVLLRMGDAPVGRWEELDVTGREPAPVAGAREVPVSTEVALAQLRQVRSLRRLAIGLALVGFVLVPREVIGAFVLERRFGLDIGGRGIAAVITGVVVMCILPFVGSVFDRVFGEDPARLARSMGWMLLALGALVPLQFAMPNSALFVAVSIPATAIAAAFLVTALPLLQQVLPARLRTLGSALGAIYLFGIGALGGALVAVALSGPLDERTAVSVLVVPAALFGSLNLIRSGPAVVHDLDAVVADVKRASEMRVLPSQGGASAEGDGVAPVLAVSGLDVSYGQVQVLFDVSFHVERGETLALLGTNGGGKSTTLRTVAGLLTPSAGSVWLDGSDITWTPPEWRAAAGIQLLPGGDGVFASMSVAENLEMGAYLLRGNPRLQRSRVSDVLDLFPALAERRGQAAGSMSGGQQQQLALARVLLHEPDVLIIDELSLGLAPIMVAELLGIVERLQSERGQTMIVVEQSVDIALSIADRAVFMEKGQVRFEGPAGELADRHDLVRAVFFGGSTPDVSDFGGSPGGSR